MGMFMGKKPEFGQRISLENLKPGDRERFCNEQLIYYYEKNLIEENLKNEIKSSVRDYFAKLSDDKVKGDIRNLIETFKKENKSLTEKDILNNLKQKYFEEIEKGKSGEIFRKIENYTKFDKDSKEKMESKKKLYSSEEIVELCKKNTSFFKRNFWLILFFIGVFAEMTILAIQATLGGGGLNPIIILWGLILAGGSFLFGYGLGKFIISKKYKEAGIYIEKEKLLDTFFLVFGILIIFGLALFRAGAFVYEEFYFSVFIITIILGIIVGLFECKNKLTKKGIEDAMEILLIKQREYATEEHIKDMKGFKDLYTKIKEEEFNLKFSEFVEKPYKNHIYSEITK